MATIAQLPDGRNIIFTKGASEYLLPSCVSYIDRNGEVKPIDEDFKSVLFFNLNEFASHSLRNIMLCYREVSKEEIQPGFKPEDLDNNLVVLGLTGIKDPLKDGIPEAVAACKRAGIVVRMVTGDNTDTAIAIAKDANILPVNYQKPEPGKPGEFSVMEGKDFRTRVEGLVKSTDEDK